MFKKLLSFSNMILRTKKLSLGLGSAVLLFLIFLSARSTNQKPLEFVRVKREDLKQEVSSSGIITGKDTANLKFKSGGKLSFINVKAGDHVTKGEILAGLDTQDLSITLQQAQNTLRDKQATIDKILDDLNGHSTDETFTQRQTRTTAEVARDNAYDSVKAAQRAFQDAVITSPIDGEVTEQNALPGQIVGASDTIAQIVDFSKLEFDADIDEADINKISLGQKTEISLNAYPDKVFNGTVAEIEPITHTTSNGATVVTVKISTNDQAIKPIAGLNGQVNIITNQKDNVLTIPLDALREDNTVLLREAQGLRSVKVLIGLKSDTEVEIQKGLNEGDSVVKNPPSGGTPRNQNPLSPIFRIFRGGGAGGINR